MRRRYVVGLAIVTKSLIFCTGKPVNSATEKSRSVSISMFLRDREETFRIII